MRNTNCWMTLSLVLVLWMSLVAPGQEQGTPPQAGPQGQERSSTEPSKQQRAARTGLSAAQVLTQRFDRSAPQIGDPVPDVAGFDEDGNEFKLRSLKGHYTVLTFGCLT